MPEQLSGLWQWVTEDPTGRAIGLGVGVVAALILLLILLKTMKWAAARWKMLFGIAVLLGAAFYGAMMVLEMGPVAWVVGGFIVLGGFMGFALFLTQGGTK